MESNIVVTIITDKGFENIAIPHMILDELNKELANGKTQIHTSKRSIECYGYIVHAKGANNQLMFLGNEGRKLNG